MSKWKENTIDLGEVVEGTTIEFFFESFEDIFDKIQSYTNYCSACIEVKSYQDNKLHISFYVDRIPFHLNIERQEVTKSVTVVYVDGTCEDLVFKLTAIKN